MVSPKEVYYVLMSIQDPNEREELSVIFAEKSEQLCSLLLLRQE
jgi:hypothetical protein